MSLIWLAVVVGVVLVALIVPYWFEGRNKILKEKYSQFRIENEPWHDQVDSKFNHFQLKVGTVNWHYVEEGDPSGPVVLFLHGFPETWHSWHYILPKIDGSFRLIALDMKGYGRSVPSEDDTNYEWHFVANQIFAFMVEGLKVNRFYLVSHDWGTLIGSVLAYDHPEHILGYVRTQVELLIGHPLDRNLGKIGRYIHRPQFLFFQKQWSSELIMSDIAPFIRNVYKTRLVKPLSNEDFKYLVYEWSRPHVITNVWRYFQWSSVDFETAMDNFCHREHSFPVLQLEGDRDPTQPIYLFDNILEKCSTSFEFQWLRNASHFINFDQPEHAALAINTFLLAHR